jgi:hypothetical protein
LACRMGSAKGMRNIVEKSAVAQSVEETIIKLIRPALS